MEILKTVILEQYCHKKKYTPIEDGVYKNIVSDQYCVTLCCELEADEDTQYPLEDVLDQYLVNCTDTVVEKEVDGRHVLIVEIEGKELDAVKAVANLVGKRVFNYKESDYVKLGIEDIRTGLQIQVIRHGKVNMEWPHRCTSIQFDAACQAYDAADLIPIQKRLTNDDNVPIYVSDLKRSQETAVQLFGHVSLQEMMQLGEVPLRSAFDTTIKLPLWVWNVSGRVQWFLNRKRQVESRKETIKRADDVIRILERDGRDCILITHGFFMKTLIKRMKVHGYEIRGNQKLGFENLQTVTAYKK